MYSLNDSKIYTMYFYLTYPPHDLPPTPHRTKLLVWFCKLGQYFPYRSVFLSHVEILNRNIFRNTPLQTFAKKITYLQWCEEHMPEQYWEVVQPHHLVFFFSTPPQSSSPNTCAWSKITSTMSMIATLKPTHLQLPANYPDIQGGASQSDILFHSCAQ